ncbi:MAG: glycosyltransferase family 2 protein [Muribaculaceae bacterium]|nr:glycosyltransferase family 2 protein [Muribaculaceae bacterium]
MAEQLVTVIVPVYNVEQYLSRCLESVVNQTYRHLEIIVVDDGSTDGSGKLCDQWAERDPRIRVIHKNNGGLSDARNAALDVMTGTLVMMVDSDDWLHTSAIEHLYKLMRTTDADIAVGEWTELNNDPATPARTTTPLTEIGQHSFKVYDRQQTLQDIFYQKSLNHSSCGRLFKASFFDDIRYPVGKLYEDLAIAYPLYGKTSRVVQSTEPLYNYMHRPSSILGTFTRQRTDVLDILDALERQVATQEPQLLPAVDSRRLSAHFNILLLSPQTAEYRDVTDRCWHVIKQLRWRCLTDKNVRMKNKMGILASYMGKHLFTQLFKNKQVN